MKKQIVISATALALLIGGTYFSSQVYAQGKGLGQGEFGQRMAEHFNLDRSEVESFMEDERESFRADRQVEFEAKLNSAVESGELTAEQKDLILAKHQELQAQMQNRQGMATEDRDAWRAMSQEEREAAREERQAEGDARHSELEAWADENGIDLQYLGQRQTGFNGGSRGGRGR